MNQEFNEAKKRKEENLNSFIWRFKKEYTDNGPVQNEVKLVDCSLEELKNFHNICKTMLYNKDYHTPGRYLLLELIKEQRAKCNAELFLRWLSEKNGMPRFVFCQSLNEFLAINADKFKESGINPDEYEMNGIMKDCPIEFATLPSKLVIEGCLDQLGKFERKPITNSFILKQGLNLTSAEKKDLTEYDSNGVLVDKFIVIKNRLKLKSTRGLKMSYQGLSYSQFRAMITLRSKKYMDLTSEQLKTLRDKVLFLLEKEVKLHIEQWENRSKQIELVAKSKGWSL